MADSVQSFSTMLRKALGDRVDADASTFVDMLAEDGVMEFPYATPGFATRLEGRTAIAEHLAGVPGLIAFDRIGEPDVHFSNDPDVVIIEFEGFGRGVETGEPYDQRYISVIRTHGGRITHYRDYWNPLVVLRATKGAALIDALEAGNASDA